MNFFDLHMHSAFSGGESSLEELASTAKQLGYKGICFAVYPLSKKEYEILKAEIKRVKKQVGIDIFFGIEARNLKELRGLAKRRKVFDILLARGGDVELNREACETPEVDILTHPEFQRQDSGLDHVCAKFAAKNNVAIEVNFRQILITGKKTRSMVLSNIQNNIKLAKKYKTSMILCSGAISHWGLRDPNCLISMACELGLELKDAKDAISKVPENIIEMVRKRKDKNWIMPGVEVVK